MRSWTLTLALAITLLAGRASGQQASASTYGFGCGGPDQPFASVLSYTGVPRLGTSVTVNYRAPTYQNLRTWTYAYLYTGFSMDSWAGMALPIWVQGRFPFCCTFAVHCMIWAPLEIETAFVFGHPSGAATLNIPANPNLIGFRLFQQWHLISLYDSNGVITTSWYWTNGGALTIGN